MIPERTEIGAEETRPNKAAVHFDRRELVAAFVALAILTAVELSVARLPGIGHAARAIALIALAIAKASLIALFFMHLKHETTILKLTVAVPLAAPPIYGLVLIADTIWRFFR